MTDRHSTTPGILDRDRLQFGLPPITTDQRTVAERKWNARTIAAKPQLPMDVGLWSDVHLQSDLVTLARKDRT